MDDDELRSLEIVREGPIAQVSLIGPGRGNAMGTDLFRELPIVFGALDADPAVRAIVLTGQGRHFSFGLDLVSMGPSLELLLDRPGAEVRQRLLTNIRDLQASITSVASCRTPIVAAVSGWCVGGGIDLIAAADVRVASRDARFSVREAKVAIVADLGSLQRLVGLVGDGHLRELALTAGDIDAERAGQIGLVNHVHETREAALEAAHEMALAMAANSPLTLAGVKDVLDAERAPRVEAGLRYVAAWNAAFMASDDLRDALAAFGVAGDTEGGSL